MGTSGCNKVTHEIIMLGFVICISNEIHSTLLHETHGFEPELSVEIIFSHEKKTYSNYKDRIQITHELFADMKLIKREYD